MLSKILPSKDKRQTTTPRLKNATYILYKLFNFVLPIVLLLLVRAGLVQLSLVIALFSKWRVFTVRPHHLAANLRTNATDIVVKLSTLAFIVQATTLVEQLAWTAWYILWLTAIKPASSKAFVSFQAAAGYILGLSAIFMYSNNINDLLLFVCVWIIALSSARHFLSSYEEVRSKLIASIWALFVLQMAWVLNNWLLVYVFVPQLIFITGVVGYALASVYNAHKAETLKASFVRQQALMTALVLLALIIVADWQGSI